MHLDLRYPIGLLLTIFGAILALHGAIVGTLVLDINVNLYWGIVMVVCGLGALYFAQRKAGPPQPRDKIASRA